MLAFRSLLRPALASGALAGLALGLFHLLASEPTVGRAIALQDAREQAAARMLHVAVHPAVSRTAQHGGLVAGALLYGLAFALLFALVFALIASRAEQLHPWRTSLLLGAAAYLSLVVVPFLKYPADPPGVGDPATIGERQRLYLTLLGLSLLMLLAAWRAYVWLAARLPQPVAQIAAAVLYVVLLGTVLVLLPPFHDPIRLPPGLLWRFRLLSLGGLTLFWAILAAGFGALLEQRRLGRPVFRFRPLAHGVSVGGGRS